MNRSNFLRLGGVKVLLGSLALASVLAGCGKGGTDDAIESPTEMHAANFAGTANATEGTGTLALNEGMAPKAAFNQLIEWLSPIKEAMADGGQCPRIVQATCDSTGKVVLQFSNCRRALSIWNGSENLQFSSQAVCEAITDVAGIPQSGSLVRTFGGTLDNSPTTRTLGNIQIALDTTTAAGYSQPLSGGVTVNYGLDASSNRQRTVNVGGIHEVSTNVANSKVRWDHEWSTDPSDPLVIIKAGAQKQIISGTAILQHNLAKFTATAKVLEPLTFSAGCCHPTGGQLKSTFTGAKTGSETMTFNSTCGNATLKADDGSEVAVTLRTCL